ncbi:PREDICTED: U6 snRNA-associated Sm-like protein LSm7 [Sturnus vulgaris]|uniref:U6 snRNA-associated Sm-like protein LSm7 n=1 Tax=Sturnus vulgaris TaxID=9172 RepID=UPI000719FCED|nr:PREDICTED: U6 snRNA-associated Sm-like protein LSm7 [Sturnus vulgaris]
MASGGGGGGGAGKMAVRSGVAWAALRQRCWWPCGSGVGAGGGGSAAAVPVALRQRFRCRTPVYPRSARAPSRRRGIPQERLDKEKKKKESILDLSKYIDKTIRVKFQGGREASGVLKGFDPLLNLVLDGTIEYMRDPDDQFKLTEDTRQLGLVVCRGTSVVLICPQDGMEAIPNPFIQQQDG